MDTESTPVDADAGRRGHRATGGRMVALLLALSAAGVAILAWQLAAAGPADTTSGAQSKSAPPHVGSVARRPGKPLGAGSPLAAGTPTTTTTGPLRVLEIGDSLGVDLGEAMESLWPPASVQLTVAARGDTGLTNSGYYNWPAEVANLLASTRPQIVIVLLGANDLQSMVTGSSILPDGTPAWKAAYAARITAVVSESAQAGARVVWIGEPAMQNGFLDAGMTSIDDLARAVVARFHGRAAYLDSNSVLAPGGSFTFDVDGPTGQAVQVRTPDGVHLMPAGADLLANAVAQTLAANWGMNVGSQ